MDFIGNTNGFVIITSAMFAIAQYADNYNCSRVNDLIAKVDSHNDEKKILSSSDELRTIYEEIKNSDTRRLTKEISFFYVLLLACCVAEIGLLLCPELAWVKYTLATIGATLVLIGGWLGGVILYMGSQRNQLIKKVKSYKQMCLISRQLAEAQR